jgi:hypothetical protein
MSVRSTPPNNEHHMVPALLAAALFAVQTPPPSVDLSSLLKFSVNAQNAEPRMIIGEVDIAFVPPGDFAVRAEVQSGGKVIDSYEPVDITRAGTMARVRFRGNNVVALGQDGSPQAFVVYVDDQVAGRLDFTIGRTTSGDAFNPITEWAFNGPWQTHAVLDYDDSPGSKDGILFGWWMSSREVGAERAYPLDIVMRRGGTIIAKGNVSRSIRGLEPIYWQVLLERARGKMLTGPDLTALNGPFVIEIKHGAKVVRSYKGAIANGKFVPHARSDLAHSEPTTFLGARFISPRRAVSPTLRTWLTRE